MEADFKIENYLEYYGDVKNVQKIIDECSECGAKLVFSHLPDYKNFIVQEVARCLDCGKHNRKLLHIIN